MRNENRIFQGGISVYLPPQELPIFCLHSTLLYYFPPGQVQKLPPWSTCFWNSLPPLGAACLYQSNLHWVLRLLQSLYKPLMASYCLQIIFGRANLVHEDLATERRGFLLQMTKCETKQVIATAIKPLVGLKEKNGFKKMKLFKTQACQEGSRSRLGNLSRVGIQNQATQLVGQGLHCRCHRWLAIVMATAFCCRHGAQFCNCHLYHTQFRG